MKRFPAEWELQSFVQIAWPHIETDWLPYLDDANKCYRNLTKEIAKREKLVIVTPDPAGVLDQLEMISELNRDNIDIVQIETNDTWARDHAFITTIEDGTRVLNDFGFNGWGMKFAADLDNQISEKIFDRLEGEFSYRDQRRIILEGGSVESDGKGTILTTSSCLLAPNRNYYTKAEAENMLKDNLHAERVLWLNHGYLAGDDTDGHIDTLARLCPNDTIVYVQCKNRKDEHFAELRAMEEELKSMKTAEGKPFRLLPLPMTDPIFDEDEDDFRLPATYANFLIMNGAVLMPTYGQTENDAKAKAVLAEAFPDREIVGVDCQVLIRQHGSLHCITMQYPKL
ncbi:MAG: agmatine deiminase family protein [Bacteroidales bacterium]|nr:agmatine deiminase family protein [Bacteroidales bacterium]